MKTPALSREILQQRLVLIRITVAQLERFKLPRLREQLEVTDYVVPEERPAERKRLRAEIREHEQTIRKHQAETRRLQRALNPKKRRA